MEWNDQFMQIFSDAVCRFHERTGVDPERFFTQPEKAILHDIGYNAHEMYGYVQSYATCGEPVPSTALLIASVRRAYFVTAQRKVTGSLARLHETDLPRGDEKLQDIAYLPRIIRKAEAKLFGTLPLTQMYDSEDDREFLRTHGEIPPADFLNAVWWAHGDRQKVISYVLRMMQEREAAREELPDFSVV